MDAVIDSGVNSADLKALEIVCKMLINNQDSASDLDSIFGAITNDIYQSTSEDIIHFAKVLLMKVEPWKVDWQDRLTKLFATSDDAVTSLYGILVR